MINVYMQLFTKIFYIINFLDRIDMKMNGTDDNCAVTYEHYIDNKNRSLAMLDVS